MSTRMRINLLAVAVIAAGGYVLTSATPLRAAAFSPCDEMAKDIEEFSAKCSANGGTAFSWNGACGSFGYTLTTHCEVDEAMNPGT